MRLLPPQTAIPTFKQQRPFFYVTIQKRRNIYVI